MLHPITHKTCIVIKLVFTKANIIYNITDKLLKLSHLGYLCILRNCSVFIRPIFSILISNEYRIIYQYIMSEMKITNFVY